MPPRTLIGGGRAMGRGAEPPAPPAPRAPRPQKARPPRTHALSVLLWALLALAGYSGSAAAEGAARLAPRQVANKPNNTVDCPVFRFGGSSPAVPVFSTPCGGSSAKTTVAMLSDVRRVVAPGSALADCKLENSKFQFSDDDGNGWLSAWTGTSGDVSSWGDLDGMFSISGGTDLQIDQGKCQSNDLSFATNVMARRLLRVQLNCNNNQFVGWLHFRWYPSNMAGTPPSELASMPCTQPSTQAYNWLTGDAFPAVSSTTRASTTVLETSSTTLRVTSTTPRTSTTVAVTSTRATTATPVVQADAATSTSVRATSVGPQFQRGHRSP
ncbi:hypothetical protein DFJ74DRAFT_123567 [Hyaloraphidium curvatum]|nr:hypothetical protein DFJ74DRAFT_123567 [Hyaloraphidium curvatum]